MPVLGVAVAAILAAGCSSSSIVGQPNTSSNPGSAGSQSQQSPSSASGGSAASAPSAVVGGSSAGPGSSAAGGGSDAAFCATFRQNLNAIKNAGADPRTATAVFDKLVTVAPPGIKAEVVYVDQAFHDGEAGKTPDLNKVEQMSVTIGKYYAAHC